MDEQAARQWILDILDVSLRGVKLTPTVYDDRAVELAIMAVNNAIIWGWMWTILDGALQADERVMFVDGDVMCPDGTCDECREVGIDPLTIIAIINAVVELLKIWRGRRS